jgi:hypothetical protein
MGVGLAQGVAHAFDAQGDGGCAGVHGSGFRLSALRFVGAVPS